MPTRRSRYFSRATIRRDNLAEDGFRMLNPLGPYLKGQIQITFINSYVPLQALPEPSVRCHGSGLEADRAVSAKRKQVSTAAGSSRNS